MGSVSESYRDWLVKAHHTASQDFDRAVMTLAGGGLGISIAFVRDIAPHPVHKWMLAIGWRAFPKVAQNQKRASASDAKPLKRSAMAADN